MLYSMIAKSLGARNVIPESGVELRASKSVEDHHLLLPSLSRRDMLIVEVDLKVREHATVVRRNKRYIKLYSL
jgi:hypothetical protein